MKSSGVIYGVEKNELAKNKLCIDENENFVFAFNKQHHRHSHEGGNPSWSIKPNRIRHAELGSASQPVSAHIPQDPEINSG